MYIMSVTAYSTHHEGQRNLRGNGDCMTRNPHFHPLIRSIHQKGQRNNPHGPQTQWPQWLPLHIDQNGTNWDPSALDDGATTALPHPEPVHITITHLSRFAKALIYSGTDGVLYIYNAYMLIIEPASGQLVQMDIAIHLPPRVCGYVGTFLKAGQETQVSVYAWFLTRLITTRKFDRISLYSMDDTFLDICG